LPFFSAPLHDRERAIVLVRYARAPRFGANCSFHIALIGLMLAIYLKVRQLEK